MSWTGKHPFKTQVSEYLTQALSFMSCAIFSQTSFRETGSLVPSTTITPVEGLNLDAPIQFDLVSPVEGGLSLTPLIGPPKLVLCSCCGVSFCHTFCPVFSLLPVSSVPYPLISITLLSSFMLASLFPLIIISLLSILFGWIHLYILF